MEFLKSILLNEARMKDAAMDLVYTAVEGTPTISDHEKYLMKVVAKVLSIDKDKIFKGDAVAAEKMVKSVLGASPVKEAKNDVNDETKIRRIVQAGVDAVKGANISKNTSLKAGPKDSGTQEFSVKYASNSFPGKANGVDDINVGFDGTAKIIMKTIKALKQSAPLEFVGIRLPKGDVFMPKSASDIKNDGDPVIRYVFKSK